MCIATVQNSVKWLEIDKQLLAITDNVDYDVEGIMFSEVCSYKTKLNQLILCGKEQ